MPWFPVDDGFAFHHKAVRAGNAAIGLWTRAGSWCAQQLTDGYVPDDMVAVLGTPAQAERLVKAGLWHRDVRGGYQFHDWAAPGRNKTRQQVEERRAAEAAKKARQRAPKDSGENERKKYTRTAAGVPSDHNGVPPESNDPFFAELQVKDVCPPGTDAGVPAGVPEGVQLSHPIPSHPTNNHPPSEGVARKRATPPSQATRIPDNFTATPEMIQWARENTPSVGQAETDLFVDYWRQATKNARKKDWRGAWQVWMRKEQKRLDERRAGLAAAVPGRVSSGSKRMDKALAALAPDDPFWDQYEASRQAVIGNHAASPAHDWLVIEGGRSA
jgi:hypothetical protein